MSKLKQLKVYQHLAEETVIDTFEAESYDDFLIISIPYEQAINSRETLDNLAQQLDKVCILVPPDADIQFYGLTEDGEE